MRLACSRLAATPLAALSLALLLAGCGDSLSRTFGLTRDAPDEFRVTTRAPLSMPPDFNLRPPEPGAPRPQEMPDRLQAEAALVPDVLNQKGPSGTSAGQQALVAAAGPSAPADIRARVNAIDDRPHERLTDRLMFWASPPQPGTVVDPTREAARLRQDAALGRSPTTGDTPIIQPGRRSGGLLDSLLNIF